jgi:hypothetical protein
MSSQVAFVTALYAVRKDYLSVLLANFANLLEILPSNCTIYVWTDADVKFEQTNVVVMRAPLEDFEVYRMCMKPGLTLPRIRNPEKDTYEYMALMNTKVEFVWRTMSFLSDEFHSLIWIDCGITKIFKQIDVIKLEIQRIVWGKPVCDRILMPGCWPSAIDASYDSICWRFCGGFFLVPKTSVNSFYMEFLREIEKMVEIGQIAWEVNVWAKMDFKNRFLFDWYIADHNDTIVSIPNVLLQKNE